MSSLPPYNARLGDRAVWICPATSDADLPPWLDRWTAVVVDSEALAVAVRRAYPGVPVTVAVQPEQVAAPRSWSLATGHPAWCEVLLRRLMGMPDGSAAFVLQAGAISIVDVLPDRAILARLNDGRALR